MSVTVEQHATDWLIRLEGQATLASATELKTALLQWAAAGQNDETNLGLDLEGVEEIDITILQLLSAAARHAANAGVSLFLRPSRAVVAAARDAGFEQIPGFPIEG